MPNRPVTEADFRMPEFRDAKPEDYEFRDDGKLVRKDRWQTGMFSIAESMGLSLRSFEIDDVVEAVEKLAADNMDWQVIDDETEHFPARGQRVRIKLVDGSVLKGVLYTPYGRRAGGEWSWRGQQFPASEVVGWGELVENASGS